MPMEVALFYDSVKAFQPAGDLSGEAGNNRMKLRAGAAP